MLICTMKKIDGTILCETKGELGYFKHLFSTVWREAIGSKVPIPYQLQHTLARLISKRVILDCVTTSSGDQNYEMKLGRHLLICIGNDCNDQ